MKSSLTIKRILLIAGFLALNAGIVYGVGQLMAYLNEGADPASIYHGASELDAPYTPKVQWMETPQPGRTMEPATQAKIQQDYLRSWYVLNRALTENNPLWLEGHYTDTQREKLSAMMAEQSDRNFHVSQITLAHQLSVDLYSEDGQLVVLTDTDVDQYVRLEQPGKAPISTRTLSTYKVVLLLEDGTWRVRHRERLEVKPYTMVERAAGTFPTMLEGMNYYPQDSPWDTFGETFSEAQIGNDFGIIASLELNTIRVFVDYHDFGGPYVNDAKIKKLEILMDLAHQNDIQVIVTLFDFYGDYRMGDWPQTQQHALTIVDQLKNHPALHSWDIKNEPDLDFDQRGRERVIAWLHMMVEAVQKADSTHPVTIGWSRPEVAHIHAAQVDYLSYHFYKDIENLSSAHQQLKSQFSKPIVLQEIGSSSARRWWYPQGGSQKGQQAYYQNFFQTQKRDSIHYLSWTLYDFPEVPSRVAGRSPWRKAKQAAFGIIDIRGDKKPAYTTIEAR